MLLDWLLILKKLENKTIAWVILILHGNYDNQVKILDTLKIVEPIL